MDLVAFTPRRRKMAVTILKNIFSVQMAKSLAYYAKYALCECAIDIVSNLVFWSRKMDKLVLLHINNFCQQ